MDKKEAVRLIIELMEISKACYLTTIDENNLPQTRAMMNLRNSSQYPAFVPVFKKHNTDFLIYFSTNTSSNKVRQIKNNQNVSVYYSKPDEWLGLMLGGKIEIITDPGIKKLLWQDNWTMYYPGGVPDDDYTVLQFKPDILKLYHRLQFFTLTV